MELSDRLWKADLEIGSRVPMFELPEPMCGGANTIISENPLVGAAQLGTLGWSFVNDQQTRNAILELVKHPVKAARAFFQDKKATYAGENGAEEMYFASGEDGVGIIMIIWSGGGTLLTKLTDKIKNLSDKAEPSARQLSDAIEDFPDQPNLANVADTDFYKYFDEFNAAEIEEYWGFVGRFDEINQKKLTKNPELGILWKKFKDDPRFLSY